MKDTEDEIETNITSETPFTRTLNKFIHYLSYRNGYKSSFKFLLPNVAVIT